VKIRNDSDFQWLGSQCLDYARGDGSGIVAREARRRPTLVAAFLATGESVMQPA